MASRADELFEQFGGERKPLPVIDAPTFTTPSGLTPYLTEPGVALLSVPSVCLDGMGGFLGGFDPRLEFTGYLDDVPLLPSSSRICKAAGQVCYASFGPKRTPNARADSYFENLLSSGHGCYDSETEVLTAEGWKSWDDVSERDRFATRSSQGELEYHHPTRLISYYHKGRMFRVDAPGVDLLVTPDHKMLVCGTTTRAGRKKQDYSLVTAESLGSKSHAYVKSASWHHDESGEIINGDAVALLGFAIGDGYLSSDTTLTFHLRKERKISWLTALLNRLDWTFHSRGDHWHIRIALEHRHLFNAIYDESGSKRIPQHLLLAHEHLLGRLYEGLMQSDGCATPTGDLYDTTSKTLAGQIQQLCLHIGLASNISQADCYKTGYRSESTSFGEQAIYRNYIIRRGLKPEVNKFAGGKGKSYWVEDWEGDVFCAEVPNNALYVRRNGRAVWSGNSVLEHANFSFLLYGISRSLTHELVRHRHQGFSQLSQRYVSGKVLRFVERPEYQVDEGLHERFIYRIDRHASEYELMSARLLKQQESGDIFLSAENKRDARKKVQQTSRSLLPNETEAPMVVTGNVRAWRHVIEQRASAHAETEIRRLAIRILLCLAVFDPILFGDYEIHETSPGDYVAETQYQKV